MLSLLAQSCHSDHPDCPPDCFAASKMLRSMLCSKPDSVVAQTNTHAMVAHMTKENPSKDAAPTLAELASKTLDLWQEQIFSTSMDPEMLALTERFLSVLAGLTPERPDPDKHASTPQHPEPTTGPNAATSTRTPPRTAPPATAPDDGSHDTGWMLQRIASLEERVSLLERSAAPRSKTGSKRIRPSP
ncbi:hypothetical protein HEQ60_06885 [Haematospirillum sp. H1815]|uniref:hypothetical protein n=1 Tax=Haematospirillum sp. H1815 TaxID=2723108 RepID=UPI00143ACBEB|nr:hypothetical protein [Haematospirillum sp. H1815]NKD77484.1 hypothetical protein [Haematospirillum sp. H1815]